MIRKIHLLALLLAFSAVATAQVQGLNRLGNMGDNGNMSDPKHNMRMGARADSTHNGHKEIPKGVRVWNIDKRFGDITRQAMDTVTHMYQNSVLTSGLQGNYNFLGNVGTPRINRIFIDRAEDDADFFFTQPYDYFSTPLNEFLFTNTLSPYTNLTYSTCGNKLNGEDHFRARFAVNAGQHWGFGFHINYLYGRGYYNEQNTSLLNFKLYGSYIADKYQAHLLLTTDKKKLAENGGITDDNYITHPESFSDNFATNEIPTMLGSNWNRNNDQHALLSHRVNVGFHRRVPMTEEEVAAKKFAMESMKDNPIDGEKPKRGDKNTAPGEKNGNKNMPKLAGRPDDAVIKGDFVVGNDTANIDTTRLKLDLAMADSLRKQKAKEEEENMFMKTEYVPVTSFIHTAQLDSHNRIYQAHQSPEGYYANDYYGKAPSEADAIFDETKFLRIRNTFAISLLEGFNKWMFAGLKVFAANDIRSYSLPTEENLLTKYTDNNISIGAQMSRRQGKTFHYGITAETWLLGDDQAQVKINADAQLNFPLFGDTVSLAAKGFFHNERPNYYLRHYHSRHLWWDDDLSMTTHTHVEGNFSYKKTRTSLRVGIDELTNYTYLGQSFTLSDNGIRQQHSVGVRQSSDAITLFTAALKQDVTVGPLNWESVLTYQKSTKQEVLPVPALNVYTNLYLKFRIAKVLYTEMGADARYFTEYEAPDYAPAIGQFVVQENDSKVKLGNYPIVSVYANFNLKGTRFFVMYTHANSGMGNKKAFLTPHYPLNQSVLRLGLSWNFFN